MYRFIFILLIGSAISCTAPQKEIPYTVTNAKSTSERKIIKTDEAPLPIGPYNQAVSVGNTLYTAGQIAINPETNEMVTNTIEEEAKQVLDNLKAIIESSDFEMGDVVKTTIYMVDLQNFSIVNNIYGSYFSEGNAPARVTVQVAALPKNANLEISMIAVK